MTSYEQQLADAEQKRKDKATTSDINYAERPNQATLRYSSSESPTDLWYNPGGGASWTPMTEELLASDSRMQEAFKTGMGSEDEFERGAYNYFSGGFSPETKALNLDPFGSYHTAATEVPGGSEELSRLLGSMFQPNAATQLPKQ